MVSLFSFEAFISKKQITYPVIKFFKGNVLEFDGNKSNLIAAGRPNEGDIIYVPLMNSFFEILFVEDQEPFFQLGNLPVYKLRARTWEYSSEKLNTGVTDIDTAEDAFSLDQLAHQFTLEDGSGSLQLENDMCIFYKYILQLYPNRLNLIQSS